jgi:hypothetical protein
MYKYTYMCFLNQYFENIDTYKHKGTTQTLHHMECLMDAKEKAYIETTWDMLIQKVIT